MVADRSKFGRTAFSHLGGLERMDYLITDESPPTPFLKALEKREVKVLIAGDEE